MFETEYVSTKKKTQRRHRINTKMAKKRAKTITWKYYVIVLENKWKIGVNKPNQIDRTKNYYVCSMILM